MAITELSKETMAAIGMQDPNDQQTNQSTNPASKVDPNTHYALGDMYDSTIPGEVSGMRTMTAAELCSTITKAFKSIFRDYTGCTFRSGVNGNLEFVMIWEPGTGKSDGLENIDIITQNKNISAEQRYVETIRQNATGRHTMKLNAVTKEYLKPFMIRPQVTALHGGQKTVDIKWEHCVEEKTFNETFHSYSPGMVQAKSILILKNINVEKLIDLIFTPEDQKKEDEKKAIDGFRNANYRRATQTLADGTTRDVWVSKTDPNKTFEMLTEKELYDSISIVPRFQHKLTFTGFRSQDPYGNIMFTSSPIQYVNGMPIQAANGMFWNLDNYWVTIQRMDIEEIRKVMPTMATFGNIGTLGNIY